MATAAARAAITPSPTSHRRSDLKSSTASGSSCGGTGVLIPLPGPSSPEPGQATPTIPVMATEAYRTRLDPAVFRLPVDKIREGYYTDAYFNFTKQLLEEQGLHPNVTMQVF